MEYLTVSAAKGLDKDEKEKKDGTIHQTVNVMQEA